MYNKTKERTIAKPKTVTLTRNGEKLVLSNRQNLTTSLFPPTGSTMVQSRIVFNQVINTLSNVCGWIIESVEFEQEEQQNN